MLNSQRLLGYGHSFGSRTAYWSVSIGLSIFNSFVLEEQALLFGHLTAKFYFAAVACNTAVMSLSLSHAFSNSGIISKKKVHVLIHRTLLYLLLNIILTNNFPFIYPPGVCSIYVRCLFAGHQCPIHKYFISNIQHALKW